MPPLPEVVEPWVGRVTGEDVVDGDQRAARPQGAGGLAKEPGGRVGVHERLDREGQVDVGEVAGQRGEVGGTNCTLPGRGPPCAAYRSASRTWAGLIEMPTTSTGRRSAR